MTANIDIKNKEEVLTAVAKALQEKKRVFDYYSERVPRFIDLICTYIDLIKSKYKESSISFDFYHIVALVAFENKTIFYLIFEQYEELEKFVEIECKQEQELIDSVMADLLPLKKYRLEIAKNDLHSLLQQEIYNFFVTESDKHTKETKEYVLSLIDKIRKSKMLSKGLKEKYKKLRESIISK